MNIFPITKEGMALLKEKIKKLEKEEIPSSIKSIQRASSFGDRSENSEYISEKQKKALREKKLEELTRYISECEIIDKDSIENHDEINFGAYITLESTDGSTKVVRIVSSIEADPTIPTSKGVNMISNKCPLAVALLRKKVGGIASLNIGGKVVEYIIKEIEYK